jgi:hypothetical protein
MDDSEQIKESITSLLRTLAPVAAVYLAKTEAFTENQALNVLLALVPVVVMAVWGVMNKFKWIGKKRVWKRRVNIALQMPEGSTERDLKAVENQG